MLTTKQRVATLLQELPDECSIEDIQYRLYVLTKVMAGLEAADTGGAVSQEQAEQQLGKGHVAPVRV
jgi:hypothetical protein